MTNVICEKTATKITKFQQQNMNKHQMNTISNQEQDIAQRLDNLETSMSELIEKLKIVLEYLTNRQKASLPELGL